MLRWIGRRISYANVAMTLALVFAMAGGAFAASHAARAKHKTQKSQVVITSTKQISSSVLAALKGNAGPTGPVGPAGAAGKDGAAGAKGANGLNGANGENVAITEVKVGETQCNKLGGSKFTLASSQSFACNGKEGAGVAMKAASATECKEGGVAFTIASKTEAACNGKEGAAGHEGPKGEPWSPNNTLPKGATETGQYALTTIAMKEKEYLLAAISFPIQLAEGPKVSFVAINATAAAPCKGTVEKPEAEAPAAGGRPNLCIFEGETLVHKGGVRFDETYPTLTKEVGEMTTGLQLLFEALPLKEPLTETFPIPVSAEGSWAVTG